MGMLMATPDFDGFSDLAVAETNQGYANSNIDVSVYKLCTEQATIGETYNAGDMYNNFYYMKGSTSALRGNADAANLMITEFEACGIGALDATRSGNTVTVTMKSCAVGYYSFGHEIGHNFGCQHDPDTSTNYDYPYCHGTSLRRVTGLCWPTTVPGTPPASTTTPTRPSITLAPAPPPGLPDSPTTPG